jgi:hypothetical protein
MYSTEPKSRELKIIRALTEEDIIENVKLVFTLNPDIHSTGSLLKIM